MEAMLSDLNPVLIDALDLSRPARIADIGCGGGGTSLAIAAAAPQGSVVHGYDISPDLIAAAQERILSQDGSLDFILADAAQLDAPDLAYDRLVSRFGVMFFDDAPSAFANLLSQLKPGGRFAFAVWGKPQDNPWMTALLAAASDLIEIERPAPDSPGPFRYGDAEQFVSVLNQAGFTDLGVEEWDGSIRLGGGMTSAEAAQFALESFSIGDQIAAQGPDIAAKARDRLADIYAGHLDDGAVSMPAHVHIVSGGRHA